MLNKRNKFANSLSLKFQIQSGDVELVLLACCKQGS